jgi:hypothetical protein
MLLLLLVFFFPLLILGVPLLSYVSSYTKTTPRQIMLIKNRRQLIDELAHQPNQGFKFWYLQIIQTQQ